MILALAMLAILAGGEPAKPHTSTITAPTAALRAQRDLLKDWALARCLARGATQPFAKDAAVSAAAVLERGEYGMDAYDAVETMVGAQLAKRYGGSVPGDYVTLKCIDLYHSAALNSLVMRQKVTPVRK